MIVFGGGAITCTLRNISETGAQLMVASPVGIPTAFTLRVESDGFTRACQIIWRAPGLIGVRFTEHIHDG